MRSHVRTEIVGGVTTFLTMSYIVFVNPAILSTQGTGMSFSGVLTATVLLCFSMTLFMGLFAKLPFAVAPGMGLNAFFTYSVILGHQVPWETALGVVFWSGAIFVLISLTPIREQIALSIPENLRSATAVGIGLFLSLIGFRNGGFIKADPATFVTFSKLGPEAILTVVSLLIIIMLSRRKNPFAYLAGILAITVISLLMGKSQLPDSLLSRPDFSSVFLKLDLVGSLKLALLPTIVAFFFTDLFDSLSTFIGISKACGLTDEKGEPRNLKQGLIVDAFATLVAGVFGTSSGTAYIESASGIESGARSGLSSVVTALCFLPLFFFAPIAAIIPPFATSAVLIMVGFLMFRSVKNLNVSRLEEAIPPFLTILLIPLTFSITQGILWGFVAHVTLFVLSGRRREIPPMLYGIAALSLALMFMQRT